MSQYKYTLAALLVWGILAYLYANNRRGNGGTPVKGGDDDNTSAAAADVTVTAADATATTNKSSEPPAVGVPPTSSSDDGFVHVDGSAIESVSTMAQASNGELLSFVDAGKVGGGADDNATSADSKDAEEEEVDPKAAAEREEFIRHEASTRRTQLVDATELIKASVDYTPEYQTMMKLTAEEITPEVYTQVVSAKPMVGLRLAEHSHGCLVKGYYVGGPADQVGIRIDDKILSIEESEPRTIAETVDAIGLHCVPTKLTKMTLQKDGGKGAIYTVKLWIMTSDEAYADKPFYYDMKNAQLIEKQASSNQLSPNNKQQGKGKGKRK